MTANKTFYNFEKIEERGQKKFKKIIAHNGSGICVRAVIEAQSSINN